MDEDNLAQQYQTNEIVKFKAHWSKDSYKQSQALFLNEKYLFPHLNDIFDSKAQEYCNQIEIVSNSYTLKIRIANKKSAHILTNRQTNKKMILELNGLKKGNILLLDFDAGLSKLPPATESTESVNILPKQLVQLSRITTNRLSSTSTINNQSRYEMINEITSSNIGNKIDKFQSTFQIQLQRIHSLKSRTQGKPETFASEIDAFSDRYQARTYRDLGFHYDEKGLYQKAEHFYLKSIDIYEKLKGKNCIDSAQTLHCLGLTYYHKKKYQKAMEYFINSLEIKEKNYGKGCLDSANSLHCIGLMHENNNNYQKALQSYLTSLQIYNSKKGKGCMESASTLHCIGSIYSQLEDKEKSLQFYLQSLEIKDRVKGKNNFGSISTLYNIGFLYNELQGYQSALNFYLRTLEIEEKQKGKDCEDISTTLYCIGGVYSNLADYSKALQFFERSQKIKRKYNLSTEIAQKRIQQCKKKLQTLPK